ncbi:MAG: hypothetical protein GY953_18440 [bacterium]|nr:hypothetical protein [bacterium]
MTKHLLIVSFLLAPAALAQAQGPDAAAIRTAMNEGLDLEFPTFQQFTGVEIVRGGVTGQGDYLYLCNALLVWKLDRDALIAFMEQEIEDSLGQIGDGGAAAREITALLHIRMQQLDEFAAGDTVSKIRFRVRLEQAGGDWVVVDARIRQSSRNPLLIIDPGDS